MQTFKFSKPRRQFIKAGCASTLAQTALPGLVAAMERGTIRKTIPASGEALSVIGLGTSRTFDVDLNETTLAPLLEVTRAFFQQGGQLIDSSPMYGNAESVTGKLLKQVKNKQDLFTATKVWTNGRESGIRQMQQSMQRLGVAKIDLMQIHNLRDWKTHIETLRQWKAEGKIRYIGITTSHGRDHEDLESILQHEALDFVQFSYNLLEREVEQRLLPIAQEKGIATLINRPFQRGSLFRRVKGEALPGWAEEFDCASWGQFFLKFVASHPAVTCVIPATSKLKHLLDNMGAGYGKLPDNAMRQRMIEHIEAL